MTDLDKIIDWTALQIRAAIKHLQDTTLTSWPCHPDVMETFSIPSKLERFLVGLLTGDPSSTQSVTKGHHSGLIIQPGYGICCDLWTTQATKVFIAPICSQDSDWKCKAHPDIEQVGV